MLASMLPTFFVATAVPLIPPAGLLALIGWRLVPRYPANLGWLPLGLGRCWQLSPGSLILLVDGHAGRKGGSTLSLAWVCAGLAHRRFGVLSICWSRPCCPGGHGSTQCCRAFVPQLLLVFDALHYLIMIARLDRMRPDPISG
jgi:rod shape-determining protein MreD